MNLNQALEDIEVIRQRLGQKAYFNGYSSIGIGLSGIFAIVGAWIIESNPLIAHYDHIDRFLVGWAIILTCSLISNGIGMFWNYRIHRKLKESSSYLEQVSALCPALLIGAAFSVAMIVHNMYFFLPVVWCCLYGLALISLQGRGIRQIEWVGAYLILAGIMGLGLFNEAQLLNSLYPGLVFATAQTGFAYLVWSQRKRS